MSQNRYEVLGKIAEGGLGSVFKAYDRNLRREVALKRVRADSPEEAERQAEQLFEEARTISTLQHPHIVTVFDVGKDDEGAYIVMELLKGETLEDIIQRGALNEGDFRELVSQSLEGMIAAHATGLIHLDIKPQNFMMIWLPSGKFQVKILDFGLAKVAHHPQIQEVDEDGSILGIIFFMAPEQFERSPVDARTDLYSLGCVYYFALTQQYPFQGETAPEVMASHMYHSMIPLGQMRPDLPRYLTAWVEWLMNRDPNARAVTASQAFEWFQAGQVPNLGPEQPFSDDGTVAMALPGEEDYPEGGVLPPPTASQPIPRYVRPGSATSPLRPTAPRPTRPVPRTPSGTVGARPVPKPVMKSVNIAAAMAPKHLQHRAPLPKWLTVWTPLVIGLGVLGYFGFEYWTRSQAEGRFDTLAKMDTPRGSNSDVNLLLNFLEENGYSEAAGQILGKMEGSGNPDGLMVRYVPKARTDWARKNLALAIAMRRSEDAAEPILKQMDTVKNADARVAFWQALARTAKPQHLPEMIGKLGGVTGDEFRSAESALVSAARQEPDVDRASEPFITAYLGNSGSDEVRATLIRVLSKLGSSKALPELTKALENTNPQMRNAAAIALNDWPNAEPVAALEAFIPKAKDSYIRTNAINSLGNLAALAGDTPQEEIVQALIAARGNTKDQRELTAVQNALARVAAPESLAFFQQLPSTQPQSKPMADQAVKSISRLLDRTVTASGNTVLEAAKADLSPGPLNVTEGAIANWFGLADQVSWLVKVEQPGEFEVQISQAYAGTKPGQYALTFGSKIFLKQVETTSSAAQFKEINLGKVSLTKPGHYRLWIRPRQIAQGDQLMRVKQVTLTRVGG